MPAVDHAATLTELLSLVDERYQAALHAGIARLSPAGLTPSPRQRAEALVASGPMAVNSEWWVNAITTAIQVAISDQTAALQSALEDLARVTQERDELKGIESRQGDIIAKTGEVALNRIAKLERERDGLAARLADSGDRMARIRNERDELQAIVEDLSAHDRQVAARVLRDAAKILAAHGHKERVQPHLPNTDARAWAATCYECASEDFSIMAEQYERGEREVPGE